MLENLTLNLVSAKPTLNEVERRKYRGHRQMSKILVETYTDFDTIMNNSSADNGGDKSAEKSKESSPMPSCRDGSSPMSSCRDGSSKRSTKDSTPVSVSASAGEVDQVSLKCFLANSRS